MAQLEQRQVASLRRVAARELPRRGGAARAVVPRLALVAPPLLLLPRAGGDRRVGVARRRPSDRARAGEGAGGREPRRAGRRRRGALREARALSQP